MNELLGGFALLAACAVFFVGGGTLLGALDSMDILAPRTIGLLGLIGVGILGMAIPIAILLVLGGFGRLVWIPMPKQETTDRNRSKGRDA